MDRDHGAAAASLLIAIFPYQRNFLVEKLTELQRSLRSLLRLRLRCPFCLANRLAALRTERQRSLTLTPAASPTLEALSQRTCELRKASCESSPASAGKELTVPFCLANRLAALRTERQHSLTLTPAASPTLEALSQRACELRKVSCESSPASAGSELTAPFFHANRLAAGSAGTA